MADAAPVLVFDGVCVFCSGWVRFILRRERAAAVRFASMQSARGRALLVQYGLDPDDPLSLLYVEHGRGYIDSDAILRVAATFGGAWRLALVARVIPRAARDAMYRVFARNRYRWFGRNEQCFVPSEQERARFLS